MRKVIKMDQSIFNLLKKSLVPRGSTANVRLDITSNYFSDAFVQDLIKELELKFLTKVMDPTEPSSKADVLALYVLLDSAGIKLTKGNDESTNSKQG